MVAIPAGTILVLFGAVVYLTARIQFRSFRLTWGLETTRLITTGLYRFSRIPQTLGSILFLAGVGFLGRSGVALILAALLFVGALIWLPHEERALEHRFGEEYRQYRLTSRRFLGTPRRARTI